MLKSISVALTSCSDVPQSLVKWQRDTAISVFDVSDKEIDTMSEELVQKMDSNAV